MSDFARRFGLPREIHGHLVTVLRRLPGAVFDDLHADAGLRIVTYERGESITVPMGVPTKGRPARAVALRRSLAKRPDAFAQWLVAHELAHAHLHNRGRTPGEDPEHAADALAAEWGFPRPVGV